MYNIFMEHKYIAKCKINVYMTNMLNTLFMFCITSISFLAGRWRLRIGAHVEISVDRKVA